LFELNDEHAKGKHVVICIPTVTKPYPECLNSLEKEVPLLDEAGWKHSTVYEIGCPYISHARSQMLRKAMDAKATVVVFIDHDLSWAPGDLLKLIEAKGAVVAGTYRFKREPIEYMGTLMSDIDGNPQERADGGLRAACVPAGFLKITEECVDHFIKSYPELLYGLRHTPSIDLFNHGARDHCWIGEDYAFCRRWIECGGEIVLMPDLHIDHHLPDEVFKGHYAGYLRRRPGGDLDGTEVHEIMATGKK